MSPRYVSPDRLAELAATVGVGDPPPIEDLVGGVGGLVLKAGPEDLVHVASLPIAAGRKLDRAQWRQIEQLLDSWKREVLKAAEKYPPQSLQLGREQVRSFLKLIGKLQAVDLPAAGEHTRSAIAAEKWWSQQSLIGELEDSLNAYTGAIKDALREAIRGAVNPTQLAGWLYNATHDASINWRAIARTESTRANAAGRLIASQEAGYDRVWCPPHIGACKSCKRLLENQVFVIAEVLQATNFGRREREWVPCIPLHPHCRHGWLPYDPYVYEHAMREHRALEAAGLTDEANLDRMFDSSGQLRPEYADHDFSAAKVAPDACVLALATGVAKARKVYDNTRVVRIEDLRIPEYQRDLDQDKAISMAERLKAGRPLEPILVSQREDGTLWLIDGQHRARAHELAGRRRIRARIARGLTLDQEHQLCRQAIGEWAPTGADRFAAMMDAPLPAPDVGKATYYRGTRPDGERTTTGYPEWDKHLFVADHPDTARLYGPHVEAVHLHPDTRILHERSPEGKRIFDAARAKAQGPEGGHYAVHVLHAAAAKGYHAVHFKDQSGMGTVVMDRAKVTGTEPVAKTDRDLDIVKGFWDPQQHGLDPLLWDDDDQLRGHVRRVIRRWARDTLGDGWQRWARLYITGGATSLQWEALSEPEADPDVDVQIVVDAAALRDTRPEYSTLPWQDAHAVLAAVVHASLHGQEVAPGLRLDAYVRPEESPAAFTATTASSGQGVWDVEDRKWTHPPRPSAQAFYPGAPGMEGLGGALAVDHPDWLRDAQAVDELLRRALHGPGAPEDVARLREAYDVVREARRESFRTGGGGQEGRGNFLWQYLWTYGCLQDVERALGLGALAKAATRWPWRPLTVAKAAAQASPNAGVEHWITVHPHGDAEKGQPVLVRNNSDGTMSVIGGAGGSLNYLRLDPKHRLDRKKADQAVSDDEVKTSQADLDRRREAAQQRIDQAEQIKKAAKQRLREYVQEHLQHIVNFDGMDPLEQQRALQGLVRDAVRTKAFGSIDRKDVNDSPPADEFDRPDDATLEKPEPKEPGPTDEDGVPRSIKGKMGLTSDEADDLLAIQQVVRDAQAMQGSARKGTNTEPKSNAYIVGIAPWQSSEARKRAAQRVKAEVRSQLARQVLDMADSPRHAGGFATGIDRGHFDSLDGMSYALLGRTVLTPEVARMLGPAASAQLVAHALVNDGSVNIDKALDTIDEMRAEREEHVVKDGRDRVIRSATMADEAMKQLQLAGQGKSDWTTTQARGILTEQLIGSSRALGNMVGSLDAASAVKLALEQAKAGQLGKIKVGGFATPAQVLDYARKARVKVTRDDITKQGVGNYTLELPPERLTKLLRQEPAGDRDLKARLQQIRTGQNLDDEIEAQRKGPGMSDPLDRNQAKGKMFLRAAGSGILGFDPGVGKTHTAIAAAMDLMHAEPDKQHRALIVVPNNMLAGWASTIHKQGSGHTVQIMGGAWSPDDPSLPGRAGGKAARQKQWDEPADFNIISYDQLRAGDNLARLGKLGHSIVIADELQKVKSENAQITKALAHAIDTAQAKKKEQGALAGGAPQQQVASHGDAPPDEQSVAEPSAGDTTAGGEPEQPDRHFWGLTGTPIEKHVGDLHSMQRLVTRAKGKEIEDRKTYRERFGRLGQEPSITRAERISQFRESLDEGLFRLTAQDAGNALPTPSRRELKVKLGAEHGSAYREKVRQINAWREQGIQLPAGGRQSLLNVLYGHGGKNDMAASVADDIAKAGTFRFDGMPAPPPNSTARYGKGDHAGTYHHKTVVFADKVQPLVHLKRELEARGITVYEGHGGLGANGTFLDGTRKMDNDANAAQVKAFMGHTGSPAVLLSSDKNNAGISLQFGDNNGGFQHGATKMVHYMKPVNNATIQQREARILRKGAMAPVEYIQPNAGTPMEMRTEMALERERRAQDLAANSEQAVGGDTPLGAKLTESGART